MFNIDTEKCSGCGECVAACPQDAIRIAGQVAHIDSSLCKQCGICIEACRYDAIYELGKEHQFAGAKAQGEIKEKEGNTMLSGYERDRGFRNTSSLWPHIGRRRGGLSRCWVGNTGFSPASLFPRYYRSFRGATQVKIPTGQELALLKEEANLLKARLEELESRIKGLNKEL